MTAGIARASLRSRPAAFAGSFVASLFASVVVSTCMMVLVSTSGEGLDAAARRQLSQSGIDIVAIMMLMISIYLSIFVLSSTMGTAVRQQQREFAMLRAIGARPWQIRRAVACQAVAAAVSAAVLGFGLGGALAWSGVDGLIDNGLVPPRTSFTMSWIALPVAIAVAVLTSAVAGVIGSRRLTGLRPARAMAEAATPRRKLGLARTAFGALALAGGTFRWLTSAEQTPDQAAQSAFSLILLFCVGFGLLGPRIIGPVAASASILLRPFGPAAQAAVLNVRSQPHRYSAALVPLVLTVAFATVQIAIPTTIEHVTGVTRDAGMAFVNNAGTALYIGFGSIAAANTLAVISHERRHELTLLRLASAPPDRLLRMAAWEAALIAVISLITGGAIAVLTLVPILRAAVHTSVPYLPLHTAAAIAGATLALAVLSLGWPAYRHLRRPIRAD